MDLRALLVWYKEAGITEYFKMDKPRNLHRETVALDKKVSEREEKERKLQLIREELGDCRRCGLWETRRNIVFGEGNPDAKVMFVGEAPGEEEDKQGRPFVGLAGQLLTQLIEQVGWKREDVYIANVLKCRPPGNRNPKEEEIEVCSPFLLKQIEAIKPKIICALGSFAAQLLIGKKLSISKIRGRLMQGWKGYKIFPTYHPAYLLRNPRQKRVALRDFQMLKRLVEEDD
ncbi:DNA polymerase bacteriophage-type [Thermosulfidibacter takaii ABI70S6]|uniref:Type-4 uracil-DNA glycosylase n=1 Tax=Thermosulfidibacter takaii (strain DSM 17441 / JCM 13301 / NBRC 103674 / ABI70S6) TaxID=1298851 RepID=A0A0S3QW46_THET7|nr:uracil-DNA glycosylase [Thermosulfidibacter takaii]BAT72555.1 DNA polymerase bacteriophage-type [Thermosulfidibacter takaii ABI70S6]